MQPIQAVLVRLSISIPGNTEDDEHITEETKRQQEMSGDVGVWKSNHLPKEAMEPLHSATGAIRKRHYRLTLPWEKGQRILPATAQPRYQKEIQEDGPVQFDHAKAAWLDAYPGWVDQMRVMKNGNFHPQDYPPADQLDALFKFATGFQPFPQANHFITTLTEGVVAGMREQFERSTELRVQAAVGSVWTQLMEPVRHMAETLGDPEKRFHDTLVGNVRDILDRVPLVNLTNNPDLTAAAEQVRQQLTRVDADELRKNPLIRKAVAEHAKEIAERFGVLGQRRLAA